MRWGRPTLVQLSNNQRNNMNRNKQDGYRPTYGMKKPYLPCDDDEDVGEPRLKVMMGTLGFVIASVESYQAQLDDVYQQGERVLATTMAAMERARLEPVSPGRTLKLNAMMKRKHVLGDVDRLLRDCTEGITTIRANLQAAHGAIEALDACRYVSPSSGSMGDSLEQVRTRYAMATGTAHSSPLGYGWERGKGSTMNEEHGDNSVMDVEMEEGAGPKPNNHHDVTIERDHGDTQGMSNLCLGRMGDNEAWELEERNNKLKALMGEVTKELGDDDEETNLKACSLLAAYLRKCSKCSCQNFGKHQEDCPNSPCKKGDFIIPSDDQTFEKLKNNYRAMVQEDPDHTGAKLIPYFTNFMKFYSKKQTEEHIDKIYNHFEKEALETQRDGGEKPICDGKIHRATSFKKNVTCDIPTVTVGKTNQNPSAAHNNMGKNNHDSPTKPLQRSATHRRMVPLMAPLPALHRSITVSTGTTIKCGEDPAISPLTVTTLDGPKQEYEGATTSAATGTSTSSKAVATSTGGTAQPKHGEAAVDANRLATASPYSIDTVRFFSTDQATKDYYESLVLEG